MSGEPVVGSADGADSAAVPISVIVATIERWPEVRPCLDRLAPQVQAVGAELILADGTADGDGRPPSDVCSRGSVRTISVPGASIFALRARAARAATGVHIAFTEDHCVPGEQWVARILDAHRSNPDALMVAGAVTNGSSDGLVDWANFLMTFAEFTPPLPARPLRRVPPMGNCSFRRSVLLGGDLPEGWLELVLAPTLVHEHRLHTDETIVVSHVQPRRIAAALAAHFHNGRSCAGLALPHLASRDWWVRMLTVPVLPWILCVSVVRSIRGRAIPARARLSLSVMWLLCAAHAAGECVGLCRGEGQSAKRLN
jgi:hypothetical protein